ncbi:amino acid adenylation domain-containing protein [Lysobacter sp. cf310]|uniref:amino acid adenylation domain-containing protein n=1 Tax=Lysobacter sp. cf310 TaxID=1761790 RepID=UPI0008E8F314|nr:amino acid adenylation domain-containing protein [Lysobacter sp. cf310]SFL13104.1 amino acid adenylation domain-containing protein [Lysobacter sp. cf310]
MDSETRAAVAADEAGATPASLFERQAARTPDDDALICAQRRYDYRELNARANALARQLSAAGVAGEQVVAIWIERAPELVIAILAVAKLGAAYLPLYVGAAPMQQRRMLEETGAGLLLVARDSDAPAFAAGMRTLAVDGDAPLVPDDSVDPLRDDDPARLAYVMYTSGSTGLPKGICTTAGNIAAFARDRRWREDAPARVLLHSSPAFDASTYELWTPLLNGGCVVLAPPGPLDAASLRRVLAAHGVTDLWLSAGLFHALAADAADCLDGLRRLIAGGDALSAAAVRRVQARCPGLRIVNGYGPTETTTFATTCELPRLASDEDEVPIGWPLDATRVHVLDERLRDLPMGEVGELYIGGAGVARGYLRRPQLDAERFLPDPYGAPGDRLYRSGDRVRRRADGALCFVGRADRQVKLRGFRVEPGEIETQLLRLPRMAQAAILVREDAPGRKRLVAYVVRDDARCDDGAWPDALRTALAEHLPDYMHPAAWIVLPTLPLTANGKLDRAALPAPAVAATQAPASPPRPQEQILSLLFAQVLGLEAVGVDDDFIALGGDSLSAVRLAALATREGVVISALQVLRHRSPARLVAAIGEDEGAERIESRIPPELLTPVQRLRAGGTPALFCIHPGSGLSWPYARLLPHLGGDCAVYGLQSRAVSDPDHLPASIEAMAEDYLRRIRELQPRGPYRLLGWCLGGAIASALAARLEAQGERVDLLCAVNYFPGQYDEDDPAPPADASEDESPAQASTAGEADEADEVDEVGPPPPPRVVAEVAGAYYDIAPILFDFRGAENTLAMVRRYRPAPLACDLLLIRAAPPQGPEPLAAERWSPFVRGRIRCHDLPCSHSLVLNLRYAEQLARIVGAHLFECEGEALAMS